MKWNVLAVAGILIYSPCFNDVRAAEVFTPYGFVLPNFTVGTAAVDSFSQANMSAPTAAGNPAVASFPYGTRMSMQVAQTRFGFMILDKEAVSGKLEFDFIDFTKASPTTTALPRLRIAKVDWKMSDNETLSMGQDWDLFSPLNPRTFNFVGNYFQAGNAGFMRHQLTYLNRGLTGWELGVALGMQFNNSTSKDNAVELSDAPTLALRATRLLEHGRLGVSAIGTRVEMNSVVPTQSTAYGLNAFYEDEWFHLVQFRSEITGGQNLANLGLLTLSQGSTAGSVSEIGGWWSARVPVSKSALFTGMGYSRLMNSSGLPLSYSGTTVSSPSTGPGMTMNSTTRLGVEYAATSQLTLYLENSYFASRYSLASSDVAKQSPYRTALVVSSGMMLSF